MRRLSDICMEEEQPGRFERDFDEVEEIGSGEFGKVMKVKNKNGSDGVLSAVKRSKSFEGAKHRYVNCFFGDLFWATSGPHGLIISMPTGSRARVVL